MKKATICMLIMALLTSCSTKGEGREKSKKAEIPKTEAAAEFSEIGSGDNTQMVEPSETPETEKSAEPSETGTADNMKTVEQSATLTADSLEEQETKTQIGEKIEPLLSEKIDISKYGAVMSLKLQFSSEMTKGDDGCCYYFRNKGKGKNKKIFFYKNDGIKVCETTMKKSIKDYFIIESFVKYKNRFFVALWSYKDSHSILTTIDLETGIWGKTIEISDTYDSIIIYDNKFYCLANGSQITVYDLSGAKSKFGDVCPQKNGVYADVQCIVDDKIYYVQEKGDVTRIKRCGLDGKKKEELFKFSGTCGWSYPGSLKIDKNYLYILGEYNGDYGLERIPLYGGKIERVAEKTGGWFELSDDSVFFFNYDDYYDYDSYYIYKMDKDLTGEAECITKAYCFGYGGYAMRTCPFYYTDGHLMVHGYNKKQRKVVDALWGNEYIDDSLWIDVLADYIDDYYWVSEDGEVEATIKGSGVKKRWRKEAKKYL